MLCSPFHKHFIQSRIRQAIFPSNRIRNSVPEFRSPSNQPAYGAFLYALIHIFCKFPLRAERKCFLIKLKAFLRNQIFIFKQRIFSPVHSFVKNVIDCNQLSLVTGHCTDHIKGNCSCFNTSIRIGNISRNIEYSCLSRMQNRVVVRGFNIHSHPYRHFIQFVIICSSDSYE